MAGHEHPAGWYPDPLGRADWRYWDGEAWNARVADRNQRTWVDEVFVAESKARAAAAGTPEPAIAPPPGPEPAPEQPLTVAAEAAEPLPESPAPKPRAPKVKQHRVRHAIAAFRSRVAADLAAHWLAYVGVVLIFVGVFGFMAFSFREVTTWARPLAELLIPLALAGAAWYLRRQRAPFVATLVAGLAGAVLPIAVITAFNDGNNIPPDITAGARPLVTGVLCVLIGAAYAWWTTRRPETPLRFLAGPAMWLGVGVAVGVFADPIPLGTKVARADAWQSAGMMIAIAITLLVARWRPRHVLARSTMTAAFPGIAVVLAFSLAALIPDGGWWGPGTATALALLVAFDLLEPRLRPVATAILDALALTAAVLTLHPPVEVAWQFAIGSLGLLALTEWIARRRTPVWLVQTTMFVAVAALFGSMILPWPAVVAFGVASLWANGRRLAPPRWLGVTTGPTMPILAATLPLGVAWGLFGAVSEGVAVLALAAAVMVIAVLVRVDRDTEDPYWRIWIPAAAALVEFGVVIAAFAPFSPMYAWLAGAAALVTITAVFMPMVASWRRWIAAASLLWTGWLTAMAFDLGSTAPAVRTFGLAIVTILVVFAARQVEERWRIAVASSSAMLGVATLLSLGEWRLWDERAWAIGFGAYGGLVAIGVLASTFGPGARRALSAPWAAAAVLTTAGALSQVVDRPNRIGEGAAGIVVAAAAFVIGVGALVLVRRWRMVVLIEIGVGALAAAAGSLAIGLAATPAEIAIVALSVAAPAALWSYLVGPEPAMTSPRSVSLLQRAGLEIAGIAAGAAVWSAPTAGRLGWLSAVAWSALAVESGALAIRWRLPNVTFLSAASVGAAIISFGVWSTWAPATWLMVGAVAAATVVVVTTGMALLTRIIRPWLVPWIALGFLGSAAAVTAAFLDIDGATRGGPGYVTAGATLAVAVVGVLADQWSQPLWRWVSALWIGLAAGVAAVAGDLDTVGVARGAAITAIAMTVLVVATWRNERFTGWHRTGTALAAVALFAAVPGTLITIDRAAQWSDVASLVTLVLFACAIEAWTFGTLWNKPALSESAPFWLVGAWCAFAAGSLSGNAQWYTLPIGVALIGVEEIRRNDHRRAGLPPYSVSGRWIEYLGMMLIVGASMFQTITVNTTYALIAVVLGMAIAAWGAFTHVRRRAVFGTAATLLAVVLMLAVPLARVLPNTPGMVVWISLAAIGVIAVTGAAFIERGRHAVRSGIRRFGSATHDWE